LVSAPSYILAKQAASGQCANYNLNAGAPSPFIPPPTQITRAPLANGTAFNSSHAVINSNVAGSQPISAYDGQIAGSCTQCACN
jgi:hypothetical protein